MSLSERLSGLLREGGISRDRREEVVKALDIGETETREIMVPREAMVVLDGGRGFEENLERMRRSGKVRYPLVRDEAIEGVVYLPDVVARYEDLRSGEAALSDLAHERLHVAPDLSVARLIDRFQEARAELATVVEGDRLLGLVTLTDALEAIVGQAEDPLDGLDDEAA